MGYIIADSNGSILGNGCSRAIEMKYDSVQKDDRSSITEL